MATWTTKNIPGLTGRVAIVTGATGGLGLETALGLAGAGAEVILAARNPSKGLSAETHVRNIHRNADVRFEVLDCASLASVEDFCNRLIDTGRPIDILVNNAGIMAPRERSTTPDGFERQLETNYLSHFALTGRLLPLLTEAKARVVQLSSIAHRSGRIESTDLNHIRNYKPFKVYSQSKLAMLMFAIELDRRSEAKGWGLISVAAHPGFAATDLVANGPSVGANAFVRSAIPVMVKLLGHTAADGALPTLMAATMPGVHGGQYFGPQGWNEFRGPPGTGKIDPRAMDAVVATELWARSEQLTGVTFS